RYKGRPLLKVSTKVLEKTAIKKVMPVAPVGVRASGVVRVRLWVDIEGKVVEAKVVSGHPMLRDSALKAASQWKWKEVECINGVPPIVVGVLNFDFPKN
ncbi:MAG TPA: TonB family protein, partial [Blastocatellia bacterium]|nr:TonB family protein [Blastocatellia bacterium]